MARHGGVRVSLVFIMKDTTYGLRAVMYQQQNCVGLQEQLCFSTRILQALNPLCFSSGIVKPEIHYVSALGVCTVGSRAIMFHQWNCVGLNAIMFQLWNCVLVQQGGVIFNFFGILKIATYRWILVGILRLKQKKCFLIF